MAKFIPVIIAELPGESFPGSLLQTIRAAEGGPGTSYFEPIVVIQDSCLEYAMDMIGDRSANMTFVTVPDGSGHAIMAAAGFVIAETDCPDANILLMDSGVDRSSFHDYHREVSRSGTHAENGKIVMFTPSEDSARPTGDYVLSHQAVREAYMTHAPGIYSYAVTAAGKAVTDCNVVRFGDAPFLFRDPGTFSEIITTLSRAIRPMAHRCGPIREFFSPWGRTQNSHEGFYRPQFGA